MWEGVKGQEGEERLREDRKEKDGGETFKEVKCMGLGGYLNMGKREIRRVSSLWHI